MTNPVETPEQIPARKSVKLSRRSREDILNSMLHEFEKNYFANSKTGFTNLTDAEQGLKASRIAVLSKLWDSTYGEYMSAVGQLPSWMLGNSAFQAMARGGRTVSECLPGRPGNPKAVDVLVENEDWDEHWADHKHLAHVIDVFKEERRATKTEIGVILESCNTTRQLLEIWPRAEPFLPAYISDPNKGIQLPALQISRLEERLAGLGI